MSPSDARQAAWWFGQAEFWLNRYASTQDHQHYGKAKQSWESAVYLITTTDPEEPAETSEEAG